MEMIGRKEYFMLINKEIVLYGAGAQGNTNFFKATDMNIPIKAFVDKKLYKKVLHRGIKVMQPEVAYNELDKNDWIISVGDETENKAIRNFLTDKNIDSYKCLEDYYVGQIDFDTITAKYGDQGYSFSVAEKYLVKNPLVYSFGVGDNWSFEKHLYNRFGGGGFICSIRALALLMK